MWPFPQPAMSRAEGNLSEIAKRTIPRRTSDCRKNCVRTRTSKRSRGRSSIALVVALAFPTQHLVDHRLDRLVVEPPPLEHPHQPAPRDHRVELSQPGGLL